MKKILHFHPNGFYAKKFVKPLMIVENKNGLLSNLVTEKNHDISDYKIEFSLTTNPVKIIFRFTNLLTFLIRQKPHIIIAHNTTSALFPLLVSRLLFIKNVIYFNHGLPYLGYNGFLKILLIMIEILNCALAKNIITVSKDMKNNFKYLTRKKVIIIYKGSASGLFLKSKKNEVNFLKKNINFNTGDKIILYVGRPNRRKGFFDIMKIWNDLYKDKNDFKLILLGITQNDIIQKIKIKAKNIFPMGFVNEIEPYYQLADYLFMTSHHEGLSYSVLESFKHRTVVISYKIDGVSELVKHKLSGFLVDKKQSYQFSHFVKYCETNKELKEEIIARAIEVLKRYDRQKFMKSYLAFLKNLE